MYIRDIESFKKALDSLEEYRGIDRSFMIQSLKDAIAAAYVRTYGQEMEIEVDIDEDFNISMHRVRNVVENVEDENREISLAEAREINDQASVGDQLLIEEQSEEFRRNAVQNAKQLIIQRVREAERSNILDKFNNKSGKISVGIVRRVDEAGNVFVDMDGVDTILPYPEQSSLDVYRPGSKLKVFVVDVVSNAKMPRVLISRKTPKLVAALFEFEVPEVGQGIIKIKGVAREAGSRTKIAVHSESEAIDPVGACVGNKSTRIRSIINELNGEKIDIVVWNQDLSEFVKNALKPAEVQSIEIVENEDHYVANVKVREDQLALAIGKKGQNARLAARLTNCKINIEVVGA